MKRAAILLVVLLAGCATSNRGPCLERAERCVERMRRHGVEAGIVYYFNRNPDGSIAYDEKRGRFVAHAINYVTDNDGARIYFDLNYDPPKIVDEPCETSLYYDSGKPGSVMKQFHAYLDRLHAIAEQEAREGSGE